jgi:Mg/Co/Ni transporter MgtE
LTLLLELPVFLLITKNGDSLCRLVGRKKYTILLGIMPLTSAIAGSVGLQASTMTAKAISNEHVTKYTFLSWLKKEVGAAFCLGISMGFVLGGLGLIAGAWDITFAISIFAAQFVNIFAAGLTGTLAPLSFSFLFHSDSRKWGGSLETAIQDIVGSFVTMIISYNIILMFGKQQVDPDDICGPVR